MRVVEGKAGRSPASKLDPPNTPEYATATLNILEMSYRTVEDKFDSAIKELDDAKEKRVWKALGFDSLDAALADWGLPPEKAIRDRCSKAQAVAEQAKKDKAGPALGFNQHSGGFDDVKPSPVGGNSASYLAKPGNPTGKTGR